MNKQGLVLNNQQSFICDKTKPNQTKPFLQILHACKLYSNHRYQFSLLYLIANQILMIALSVGAIKYNDCISAEE